MRGLRRLYEDPAPLLYDRDIKAGNILLNDDGECKLGVHHPTLITLIT